MTTQNENTGTALAPLTPRQERQLAVRDEMAPGARPSAIVPRNFLEVQQMCQALANADLVPKAFKNKPADMTIVIMTGAEIGIPPMAALRLFTTWDGVPRLMAEGIRAVLLSHPDIEYLEPQTCDEKHATWIGKRRGRPEKTITWTMERARRAELDKKPIWQKYQENMLNARASMDLGRLIAPDIIAGMRSLEEAQDNDFIDASSTETRSPAFAPLPAQKSEPVVSGSNIAEDSKVIPTSTGTKAKAKPIEAKSTERPTTPPASSAGAAPDGGASTSKPAGTPSVDATPASGSSQSSKLDEAKAKVEAKRADPTPAPGGGGASAEPATSTLTASASSPTTTPPGASTVQEPEDDGFGGGDEPAATPLTQVLKPFHEWLASCKNRRELIAGLQKWKAWSIEQAKAGNNDFLKAAPGTPEGKGTIAMSTAYADRKSQVPE